MVISKSPASRVRRHMWLAVCTSHRSRGYEDARTGVEDLSRAELYDPVSGTFSGTGSMISVRDLHTATRLLDGRVLVVGGTNDIDRALASAEIYDPKTGVFAATGSMAVTRESQRATLLLDGRVLVVGGLGNAAVPRTSIEVYDPGTGAFGSAI